MKKNSYGLISALNESFIEDIKEKRAKTLKESQKLNEAVNPNDLTKEQLWKLRQEIVLGSLYTDDYKNSFNINPENVAAFFDSFIEDAQRDDEGNYNERKTDEFDNPDDLYNYYLSCENPFGELKESDNKTYKDRDEAEYYRNKELYANSNLARHKEAMEKARKACSKKGIKLKESKLIWTFAVYIDGLQPVMYGDDWSVEDAKKEYIENEGKGHDISEVKVEYFDEPVIEELGESEEKLNETGEWDDNDEEMQLWLEDLKLQAEEIARNIDGEVKVVKGFDAYQGPFAIIHSPKHGDIELWYDQEDDTGRSFNAKVAHVGWLNGSVGDISLWLNQDEIPEEFIINESIESEDLNKDKKEILTEELEELVKKEFSNGKIPDEIQYKGKTYKAFNVMSPGTDGKYSQIYFCNMENTPSGDPQESNDYFFVKVELNPTDKGYKGVKEIKFIEDLTESEIDDAIEDSKAKGLYSEEEKPTKRITKLIDKSKVEEKATFKDKVKAIKGSLMKDKRRINKSAQKSAENIAGSMVKEEDLIQVNAVQTEPDYVITDVTELEDTTSGDIQSPDIDAMLTMIQESIKDVYGPDSIKIHIHSSNLIENGSFALVDIQTPEILKEFEKINSKDTAVGKSLILENKNNGLFEFRVNNTTGTTRYIKRTRKPAQAIYEWLETEFLAEAKKAKEEEELIHKRKELEDTINQFLSNNKDLQLAIETIKMYIDAIGKEGKEPIQGMIEKVIVEFPVGISTTDDSLKFDSREDVIEIIFGKQWIKEEPKEVEPSVPGTEVIKESKASVEELWKYIDSKPNLKYIKDIKDNPQEVSNMLNIEAKKDKELYRLLHESSLNESYQQFNIGEIEVVYNPETQEVLYSIGADDTHDKKINLTKVPSVETPYNTETIIKNYIERQYGEIPEEIENKEETQEDLPLPTEEVVTDEVIEEDAGEELENPIEQDADISQEDREAIEDSKSETGSAKFQKIKPNSGVSVEDIRETTKEGTVQADSSYIVVEERELSDEEFNGFTEDLSQNEDFFVGITPIDRKNYAFNVIKITNQNSTFDILADPVGYNYARYVAIVDKI